MADIVILHGWGSCAKNWQKVKELLESQGHKTFAPDLPGFGENPAPAESWFLENYAEWLNNFCEKNNLSQVFLLGHSFGGGIAVKFSLKNPQKIKKLFLVNPAIIRKKTLRKEIIKKLAKIFSFLPDKIKNVFYGRILKSDYFSSLKKGEVMKKTYLKVAQEDLSLSLCKIKTPTLIVWGKKDKTTPLKDAYIINQKIKDSELKIIENCSHAPNLECPEELTEIILNSF